MFISWLAFIFCPQVVSVNEVFEVLLWTIKMNSRQNRDSNLVLIHLHKLSLRIPSLLNTFVVQYVKIGSVFQ